MTARILLLSAVTLLMSACATAPDRTPLPLEMVKHAEIPGVPRARFWGDEWPQWSQDEIKGMSEEQLRDRFGELYGSEASFLAISGGGSNGAFGAGLLSGWTASGTRPDFTMVTGISTGALTAPFAFLGPDYDDVLKTVYTTVSTEDIAKKRRVLSIIKNDALADSSPLRSLIEKHVNDDVIAAIAEKCDTGRRLFIGTMNLDAQRPVIWSICDIVASDYPRRNALIHDVLLASSAIPVAFPPVVIPVDAQGQVYDEMHVDGGTGQQVFVYPAAFDFRLFIKRLEIPGQPRVYVVRNAFLEADYNGVKRTVFPIAERSIESLIRTQGVGDLFQIHSLCMRDGNDFNLAYISAEFTPEPTEGFDPVYMNKLFDYAYDLAKDGYDWEKAPPGFDLHE